MNPQVRLHLVVFLWGFTAIVGKLISISATPLVWWRMLIAFISIFFLLKISKIPIKVTHKQLWQYLGIGALIGIHWIMFFASIKVSNVSVALSTLATGSLFTAFIEPVFFKRKIVIYEIVLSLIVVFCIWLIFQSSPEYLEGILLGVGCCFIAAIFSVLNAVLQKNPENKPRKMMFYEMIGGFVTVSLVLLFTGNFLEITEIQNIDILWLIILGVLLTAVPMIESIALMKYMSPYTLLLTVNLEPVYGIILAYLIFGESEEMKPIFYIATAVMVGSIVVNGLIKQRKNKKLKLKK